MPANDASPEQRIDPSESRDASLAACPFCGVKAGEAHGHEVGFWPTARMCLVVCFNCHAGTGNFATRAEAIAAWNRRALTPLPDLSEVAKEVARVMRETWADEYEQAATEVLSRYFKKEGV